MRIFLDTNVLVSAAVFGGCCAELLSRGQDRCEFLVSEVVWREFDEKLSAKFAFSDEDRAAARSAFDDFTTVPGGDTGGLAVRDPDDVVILAAAISAGADILATGDGDLLVLEKVGALEILTPRQLLDRLAGAE